MGVFEKNEIRDLKPENKKARENLSREKQIIKPWGVYERLFVLVMLLLTVGTSTILALSARNFKLPNLPKISIPDFSKLNPFEEDVIVVGNKGSSINLEKIENVKKLFKDATNGYSGIYAFYIYDLNGDYYYGLNHQEKMQAASLIKLPVMYLAIQDEKKWPDVLAMGKKSDNNIYLKILETLGKENINKAILDLGMINTSLSENITTPEDIGLFFKKLYKKELLSDDLTNKFLESLTDTNFEKWLRLGIPSEIRLAHKYGREVHSVNDAGVVMSSRPFVLVIMTDGVVEKEADELFPKLTKLLYTEHTR